jgi:hypothetical protein
MVIEGERENDDCDEQRFRTRVSESIHVVSKLIMSESIIVANVLSCKSVTELTFAIFSFDRSS